MVQDNGTNMIWREKPELLPLNQMNAGTATEQLGIEFIEVGADYLVARMPVDHRTRQPMGLLHGGASALLAETIGSVASMLCVDFPKQRVAGIELNASHVKAVKEGFVRGTARPLRLGLRTHVWSIDICDEDDQLVCVARLTMMVI